MLIAAEPTMTLVLFLTLLLVGVPVAMLIGLIYGIAKKRPAVAVASIAVPALFAVILLLGAMAVPLIMRMRLANADGPMKVEWSTVPTGAAAPAAAQFPSMAAIPPMPAMPSLPPLPAVQQLEFGAVASPSWIKLALVVLVVLAIAKCVGKRGEKGVAGICLGVGKVALVVVLLVTAVRFYRQSEAEARLNRAIEQKEAAQVAQEVHQHVADDPSAQQVVDQVAQQYGGLNEQSIQAIWEKLNEPRIELEADAPASEGDSAKFVVSSPVETPESLTDTVARLERMVAQVSTVADKVSDTGTLIGKAMIALNETMDSRSRTKDFAREMTAEKTVETVAATHHVSVVMAPVPAELEIPVRKTLEIVLDQGKLNQFETTFEKIKTILGRDGRWHGTTVRYVPHERRIVVSGDFEDDYEARLRGTLVNTMGKHRTPIHLSDLATITASPEPVVANDASGEASAERPAWVDEAPKNVGNVRRQVLVAGDFATLEECVRETDLQLFLATYNRIRELSNSGEGPLADTGPEFAYAELPGQVRPIRGSHFAATQLGRSGIVGIDFIRREIAKQEFTETVERSFGPMKKLYTQIEFSPSIDQELLRRWDEFRRSERFVDVGVGAGSVLGLIGLAFGLLRVDTWTKGYYSKRLFLGVPAAIIGAITLLVMAAG